MSEVETSQSAVPPTPLVFSVEAAAEALSISRTRMFKLLKSGAIPSIRVGRLRRITAAALNEYVDHLTRIESDTTTGSDS